MNELMINNWFVVSTYPSEKYEFVSWDYEMPNWMESHSKFHGSSHHQPVIIIMDLCWVMLI